MKSTVGLWQLLSGFSCLAASVSVFLGKTELSALMILIAIFCAISEISARIRDKGKKE